MYTILQTAHERHTHTTPLPGAPDEDSLCVCVLVSLGWEGSIRADLPISLFISSEAKTDNNMWGQVSLATKTHDEDAEYKADRKIKIKKTYATKSLSSDETHILSSFSSAKPH